MSVRTSPFPRPWQEIAAEITQEQDSRKMLELVRELERALEEQRIGKPGRPSQMIPPS